MIGAWLALAAASADRALLIDTSIQPAGSTWTGAKLDRAVPSVRAALERRGFADVVVLSGADATLPALRAALEALGDRSGPGDRVVLYYTGHGAQGPDDGRDEPDGLDELLVPYGAGADASGYLRDDELGLRLDALAARLGPAGHLLVILDACHSGSATRGHSDPQVLLGRPIGPGLAASGVEGGSGWDAPSPASARAPTVVLAAARHDEPARWEAGPDGPAGVLTQVLVPELVSAPADLSYRGLLARLETALARRAQSQHTQVEGAVDATVLGGAGAQQPFFPVASVEGTRVTIEGGPLAGLSVGSEVEIHPAGTRAADGSGPAGTVAEADGVRAIATVDRAPAGGGPSWALVTRFAPPEPLRIRVDPAAEKLAIGLRQRLASLSEVAIVDDGAGWSIEVTGKGRDSALRLVPAGGGDAVAGPPRTADDVEWDAFVERIRRLAVTRAFRELRLESEGWRLDVAPLAPVRGPGGGCVADAAPRRFEAGSDGRLVAAVGDAFALDVRYDGPDTAHLSIVVFEPGGLPAPLYPGPGESVEAARIEPGTAFLFGVEQCLQFTTPGTYVVRAHATDRALDPTWLDEAIGPGRGDVAEPAALVGATAAIVVEVR